MDEGITVRGRVVEQLPSRLYRVELEAEGRPLATAHVAEDAHLLRLRPGDAVLVTLSPFDRSRGRIVGRPA